jgi:crossover junction endodeoxyribonuclease RuvC
MRILGIDPGLTKTGFGIIEIKNNNFIFINSGTIYTDAKEPIANRLYYLHDSLTMIIKEHFPDEAAIEETFVNINPASSLKLGQARGSLILTLGLSNLKVFEYSSTAVKKSVVGVGKAKKEQVMMMIKVLLPKSNCKSEDEADALAVAICHNNNKNSWK